MTSNDNVSNTRRFLPLVILSILILLLTLQHKTSTSTGAPIMNVDQPLSTKDDTPSASTTKASPANEQGSPPHEPDAESVPNSKQQPPLPNSRVASNAVVASTMTKPKSMWANDPELLNVVFPTHAKYAIIEVGTNVMPDYLKKARNAVDAFLIGLEPIVTKRAQQTCTCFGGGKCKILKFAVGPHEQEAVMNVAASSVCSSLLPLSPDSKFKCTKKSRSQTVKVLRLDTLIAYALPPDMPIRILMLDMQGFDLYGAASLTEKHFLKNRIANFILECEDYPVSDPRFLSPGAKSCGEAISCITEHWGYKFVGCTPNVAAKEYNCAFYNPDHEDGDPELRHPFKRKKKGSAVMLKMEHPAECPAMFKDISLVPTLPTPSGAINSVEAAQKPDVATIAKPQSIWASDPSLNVTVPEDAEYAIIEVGTGAMPEYLIDVSEAQGAFLLGLEPIVTTEAEEACTCRGGGQCRILKYAIGPHEQKAVMNVPALTRCASLLPLNDDDDNVKCTQKLHTRNVKVIRLDTLIAYTLPPDMPIRILMLDIHGFNLHGAASLTNKHFIKTRVANLILECHDLPVNDPRFITKGARSCGEAVSCVTKHWGYEFLGCTRRKFSKQYNCMFTNTEHKDTDPNIRYPRKFTKGEVLVTKLAHPARCPALFTDLSQIPELPSP